MRARCGPRAFRVKSAVGIIGIVCVLCACSPGGESTTPDDAGDEAPIVGDDGGPTYQAVYAEILSPNCALPFCHGGAGDYLQLGTADIGYRSLVGAAAQGPMCAPTGLDRVDPGHPDRSLLFLKITNPPCGSRMPLAYGYSGMLTVAQIDQIGQWIACGALPGAAACPTDAGSFTWDGAVTTEAGADAGLEAGSGSDAAGDGAAVDSAPETAE
jgi:hypothetical protein